MPLRKLPAVFARGGTSKALLFHRRDLPADWEEWAPIFLAVMGSPDPDGRQLDGMGGGISSLSKVCVIGPPTRADADVDYTFAQVSVDRATVDYGGNCGNMSSAIGPFAVDERLVKVARDGEVTVRIHNTNTGKLIHSTFEVESGCARVDGPLCIDGVAGSGAPIRLEFRDLAGARTGRLLPAGGALHELRLPLGGRIRASMVDAGNPCVFVDAEALGLDGTEAPERIESQAELMHALEDLRIQASMAMKLSSDEAQAASSRSVPFIGAVARARSWVSRSGHRFGADDADLCVRMLSSGNAHRAIPITSALCVAVACRTAGTLPAEICRSSAGPLRIGHPSGVIVVEAERDPQTRQVRHASVYRTARRLFQGEVLFATSAR
ncbi:MAG TPA: PrpF domain-containing protein [Steroidobacteraceae bacterium]|nr:PrpF domain-containing protein [Steroidobacteraceae bacterium]